MIFFSSIRAQVVEPGQGVYAATKAGTLQMIRALAAELGPRGVRANAVAPGVVETPLTSRSRRTRLVPGLRRALGPRPLGATVELVGAGGVPGVRRGLLRDGIAAPRRRRLDGHRRPLHAAAVSVPGPGTAPRDRGTPGRRRGRRRGASCALTRDLVRRAGASTTRTPGHVGGRVRGGSWWTSSAPSGSPVVERSPRAGRT
jgi:hypothetical protein